MPNGDGDATLLRLLVGRHDAPHSGGVGRHGLLHENMLARRNGCLELVGSGAGWPAQEYQVDVAGHDRLERMQPHELTLGGYIDVVREPAFQRLGRERRAIAERIGQGDELHVRMRLVRQHIQRCTRAAAAAADQRERQRVVPRGMGAARDGQAAGHRGRPHRA